jgi:hypothetical protein
MWLPVPPESLAELERLNAAHDDRRIEPVIGPGGSLVVSDDAIGDPYWSDYAEWFANLLSAQMGTQA